MRKTNMEQIIQPMSESTQVATSASQTSSNTTASATKAAPQTLASALVSVYHFDRDNNAWKSIDGGNSRLYVYFQANSKNKYRLVNLTAQKKCNINVWINNTFKFRKFSERFLVFSYLYVPENPLF